MNDLTKNRRVNDRRVNPERRVRLFPRRLQDIPVDEEKRQFERRAHKRRSGKDRRKERTGR